MALPDKLAGLPGSMQQVAIVVEFDLHYTF